MKTEFETQEQDILVVAMTKDKEQYVFLYADNAKSRVQVLRQLGRFAINEELSFTWSDAAILSQKVREGVTHDGVHTGRKTNGQFKM